MSKGRKGESAFEWAEAIYKDIAHERGEDRWVNFDPSVGSKNNKNFVFFFKNNDASNKILNQMRLVPLTKQNIFSVSE